MAYPPIVPPTTRANATPQLDSHPADHNALAAALNNVAWGVAGYNSSTATGTITATEADVVTVTFTAVAGRRYKITASAICACASGAPMGVWFKITDGANVAVAGSSNQWTIHAVSYAIAPVVFAQVAAGAAGSRTYKLRAVCSASASVSLSGSAAQVHQILVEDVGS